MAKYGERTKRGAKIVSKSNEKNIMATMEPSRRDHLHFLILGFSLVNGARQNMVEIVVIADDTKSAFKKANEIILCENYAVARIEECGMPYTSHDRSLDMEIQRVLQLAQLNHLKGREIKGD